jgi:choline dehydrogenase-like flavoprotein
MPPDKPSEGGPNRPNGIYVIRYRNTKTSEQQKDFIRGYGFQGGGGSRFNYALPATAPATRRRLRGGDGRRVSRRLRRDARRFDNFVEIDPGGTVDTFGIPVLKISAKFGDNEFAMMKDMAATAAEMIEESGAKFVQSYVQPNPVPGWGIHEVGIARMGDDPKTSVLDAFCQTHDVKNLFVMDGSCFVSIACQNPTLTIMAITVRSTDHLLEEMRRGNV